MQTKSQTKTKATAPFQVPLLKAALPPAQDEKAYAERN
jgi:hypothetical protein